MMEPITSKNSELVARLYEQYAPEMRLYFSGYTHDMMAAEDMTQELFIKVLALDVVNTDTVKSLLLTIARRMIVTDVRHRDYIQRRMAGMEYTMDRVDNVTAVEHVTCRQIEQYERGRLSVMPVQRSKVYRMFCLEEMSLQDVADVLHLSRRTVENHLYISRKEMKKYMRSII